MSQVYGRTRVGLKWHRQNEYYTGWSHCWAVRLALESLTDTRPPEEDICRNCEPAKKEK